jgi:hypothetical protein
MWTAFPALCCYSSPLRSLRTAGYPRRSGPLGGRTIKRFSEKFLPIGGQDFGFRFFVLFALVEKFVYFIFVYLQ